MTLIEYKPEPIPVEPKLYAITLHANQQGNVLIWHCVVTAFDPASARSEAASDLKDKNPDLYDSGLRIGGWHVQSTIELTAAKIDQMLTEAQNRRRDIEEEKDRKERNELMQTIIDSASRKLLNKYRDRFTTAEVGYLEDEIIKYEQGG